MSCIKTASCCGKITSRPSNTYPDFHGFDFTKDANDTLLIIENVSGLIHFIKMTSTAAYHQNLKSIRNVSFQYPYIVYVKGTKEVWIQDLNNNIKVFYFDSDIT